MNIVVLVKHAFVSELRPSIRADGKGFEEQNLVYEMNDWDRYALEEVIPTQRLGHFEVKIGSRK